VHAQNPVDVDNSLQALAGQQAILGEAGVRAKQSSFLYESLKQSSPQHFDYLLYKNGVIPPRWYWWYAKEWRSKTTATIVAFTLLIAGLIAAHYLNVPAYHARYYVWRLCKDNASEYDRFRARCQLATYIFTTSDTNQLLAAALRSPNLPVKTADSIVGLLLETQQPKTRPIDFALFGEALRTDNFETRLHIQRGLLYVADLHGMKVSEELRNWQPDPKDTQTDIDKVVKRWHDVR
jgi:hypothetical protein